VEAVSEGEGGDSPNVFSAALPAKDGVEPASETVTRPQENVSDVPEVEIPAESPDPVLPDTKSADEDAQHVDEVTTAPAVIEMLEPEIVVPESDIPSNSGLPDKAEPQIATQGALALLPEPESPEPDPNLPARALGVPAQGSAPEIGDASASAPANEAQPLLGDSSPPLSLAQVLPPGEAPAPNQLAPSFDLVRVSPDGSALIAGRAEPGATVQVFSGVIPVAEATASARGEFVVFLNAPSDTTLDLQIPAAPEGAELVVSQADVVILPAAPDAEDTTPIVVRRTPDSVQILQPSAPVVPGNISLDLVSYTDSGAVQLAGRGNPENIARVYADSKLAGEVPIAEGGTWELEIADIAEGRYVLRVDEISATGDVISRTESPFQRQFPEAQMPESFSQGAKIIVQPGNTLWLMAAEAYGDGDEFLQIFTANKDAIRDPDLIYPGQIFSIPRNEE